MKGSVHMRYFRKNLCLLLAAVLCAPVSPCAGESREETHLVIFAVSDMHGNILGYSYEKQTETGNDGMARL